MTKDPIDAFIDALVSVPSGKDFINIYGLSGKASVQVFTIRLVPIIFDNTKVLSTGLL